jgi:pimeloyl-ACP methyl ester carboxylesterase
MSARSRVPALGTLVALILAACTGGGAKDATAFRPSFLEAPCPPDVEILQFTTHSCGYLTVLENRAKPAGRTIQLFVMKSVPPDKQPAGIALGPGGDIGNPHGWADSAAGAARTHSILYSLQPRGAGYSGPDLSCPEVDSLAGEAAEASTSDAGFRQRFLSAVKTCHDRLVGQGIDLSAYDLQQAAADFEDLRQALGISTWSMGTLGTMSRLTLEAAREFPQHLTHMFMDSPQFPQVPAPEASILGTRDALQQLAKACVAAATCRKVAPHITTLLSQATARFDAHPITFIAKSGYLVDQAGRPVRILVDGGKLLRAVRFALGGDGPLNIPGLPSTIAAAAKGKVSNQLATILSGDPTLCAGYRPSCPQRSGFSWGLYLSVFCRDEAPFVDQGALGAAAGRDPAYRAAFEDDPYLAACRVWGVPPAHPSVQEPVSVDTPMLIMIGQFDSFSPLKIAQDASSTLPGAYVLQIPTQTHNVMGFDECPIQIRNAWIEHPEAPPPLTDCLPNMPADFPGDP